MKHEFLSFDVLPSTNDYLKERYRFFNDGVVAETKTQTNGKGRLGRRWEDEGNSLLFSVLLKDERKLALTPLLPLIAGGALLKTFEEMGLNPSLKWPNDIYLGDKKAAGILVEGVYTDRQEAAIVGIGINANQVSFPSDIPNATSLRLESGKTFDLDDILALFLSFFDCYIEERIEGRDTYFEEIPNRDYLKGKPLVFDYYGEDLKGTSLGIQKDGSISIEDMDGKRKAIASGEANLRKASDNINQSEKGETHMNPLDLEKYGIEGATEVVYNPSYELLHEEETKETLTGYEKGQETELGAVNVMTGVFTGRSPKDKYIVMDENSKDTVWWNSPSYPNDNHPMSIETWNAVKKLAKKELSNKRLFVIDAYCGANKDTRMAVRFVVEVAWQAHFIRNMFIRPTEEELKDFKPDFIVYNASKAKVENYKELGLNSETVVAFNITSKEQVILNTWYGGEMKKGMFSMMNYYLPLKGIAAMHCSANTDMNGENTAIFFGLSGTGKTTLSTDPKRLLIGDDEHGWDDNGVFNFEGGCYAKVINLDKESEPDIYNAIRRDALLENVTVDEKGKIDFADKSVTENTRVSYPIYHIKNIVKPISHGPAAKNVIFLSADAFGVLPPVSILTPEQTQYYFLSGFTAKLAGTERGITTPTPTFSACFGQAFLELHPTKYAQELVKKMKKNGAKAYLVNTGWNGSGKRISIKDTRGIIDAILDGSILKAETKKIPFFDFEVPTALPGVDSKILDPRDTYANVADWEAKAKDLASRFQKNFVKYENNDAGKALVAAGPKLD